jgi:hypothetical protein
MTSSTVPLTQGTAWNALREHYEAIKVVHMRDLFAKDPGRGARLVCDAQGIFLDYSKNRLTDDTMRLLLDLANAAGLRAGIDAMFRSDKLNVTENRAVLYVALRAPADATIKGGIRLQSLKHSWRKACQAVGVGQMVMDARKSRKVWLSHRKRRANAHFREETRGSSRRCIVRA